MGKKKNGSDDSNSGNVLRMLAEELDKLERSKLLCLADFHNGDVCALSLEELADLDGLDFTAGLVARSAFFDRHVPAALIVQTLLQAATTTAVAGAEVADHDDLRKLATILGFAKMLLDRTAAREAELPRSACEDYLKPAEDEAELLVTHTSRAVLRFAYDVAYSLEDLSVTVELHTRAAVRSLFETLKRSSGDTLARKEVRLVIEQIRSLGGARKATVTNGAKRTRKAA